MNLFESDVALTQVFYSVLNWSLNFPPEMFVFYPLIFSRSFVFCRMSVVIHFIFASFKFNSILYFCTLYFYHNQK